MFSIEFDLDGRIDIVLRTASTYRHRYHTLISGSHGQRHCKGQRNNIEQYTQGAEDLFGCHCLKDWRANNIITIDKIEHYFSVLC